MSYTGYYVVLPSRRSGFDSRHPLQKKRRTRIGSALLLCYNRTMTNYDAVLATPITTVRNVHTVKEFLEQLLLTVWTEEEEFSGKRPFGNSGWKQDIAVALIEGKVIDGELDEDGYIEDYDRYEFETLMKNLIAYVFNK
jgi:hypothetical protein